MKPPLLLEPLQIRGLAIRNRIVISPMCQYAADNGLPGDWQLVHLGRFAIGGAGLIFTEATAIEPRGRISHACAGIWTDAQAQAWARVAAFAKSQGAAIGIQLAHAGRKASLHRTWEGGGPLTDADRATGEPPWESIAPSAIPYGDWPTPHALTEQEITELLALWRAAAQRALDAGFDAIELHGGHGYLLHSFMSPLSNHRNDAYGGDASGRMRFPLEVVDAVRTVWPEEKPLFYRLSAVDYAEGGLVIEDTVRFARELKLRGVDVVDCSSGSIVPAAVPIALGYQTLFADSIRRSTGMMTMAVGLIIDPRQAEQVLLDGRADLIAIGRAALADPNWPVRAKTELAPAAPWDAFSTRPRFWLKSRAETLRRIGVTSER
jgi:2,4-dienoyl-CoA reductase-like NADH-dependent reductase (Old Yellow Enzyme family)